MKKILRVVQTVLGHFGLKLVSASQYDPVDLRGRSFSVRSISYFGRSVLMDAPLDKGRGLPLFSFGQRGTHPFVRAVIAASKDRYGKSVLEYHLRNFYRSFAPDNASIITGENSGDLAALPAWWFVPPWSSTSPEEWAGQMRNWAIQEGREHGHTVTIEDGWTWFGPVTEAKLLLEVERVFELVKSMRASGYTRGVHIDGDVRANLLVRGVDDWRWQAIGGQHRCAVASALAIESVPIKVIQIVREEDVDHWPGVLKGIYSRRAALCYFNRVFNDSDWVV